MAARGREIQSWGNKEGKEDFFSTSRPSGTKGIGEKVATTWEGFMGSHFPREESDFSKN